MIMGPPSHDTDPDNAPKARVPTDPGIGEPPSSGPVPAAAEAKPASAEKSARSASTEATPVYKPKASGAGRTPSAPLVVPDPTPVPPETTDLLHGLLRAENDAYFHKTKATAASSGEAAAAFHAGPRGVAPGADTPTPAPPVVLRPSVEADIAQLQRAVAAHDTAPDPIEPPDAEEPIVDRPVRSQLLEPTELGTPRSAERSRWVERAVAFAGAAVAVMLVAVMIMRWRASDPTQEAAPSLPTPVDTTASAQAPAPPDTQPVAPLPATTGPILPTTAATTAAPVSSAAVHNNATGVASARQPKPGGAPRAVAPAAPVRPGEGPAPKDDVKRTF